VIIKSTVGTIACSECGKARAGDAAQWWQLGKYHGITGYFCSKCYEKVSHDAYDKPNDPAEYLLMLLKHGTKQPS
jgi:hypothetical protein